MKKLSILQIYLILALLVALAGVLVYTLFRHTAAADYRNEIRWNVDSLQESVYLQYTAADGDPEEFFQNVSGLMHQNLEKGTMLALDDGFEIVHPVTDEFKQSREMLVKELSAAIQNGLLQNGSFFTTAEGKVYYVNCRVYPPQETGFRYFVVYKEITTALSLFRTSCLKLLIICGSAALILILLLLIPFLFMNQSLSRLCEEVDRLGPGNTSPIAFSSRIREPEQLRVSLNHALDRYRTEFYQYETLMRSMTHEMRNDLTSIEGYAQGIELGVTSYEEAARTIRAKSENMSSMLENLSMLSYLGMHPIMENDRYLSVVDETEKCLGRFLDSADQKHISIVLNAPDHNLAASVAPELFYTVLSNLVSNAIRYSRTTVTVSILPDGDLVRISVADDGTGISERDMPHIFEQFYKGPGGQSGIGLAVAQEAAKSMGGSLTAENRPEGGAVFTFSLNAAAETE